MTRRTLAREVALEGIALHAGIRSKITLKAAAPGTGIVFRRCDVSGSVPVKALWSNVTETKLGTVLTAADGTSIAVVEHLMSALAGAGIDDCSIDVEGPEPPILDGDALSFLTPILEAGFLEQGGARPVLSVLRSVEVSSGNASCRLVPSEALEFQFEVVFESAAIGRQEYDFAFSQDGFRTEVAPARTFGFLAEAEKLRAAGLARGADRSNTLVIDGDRLVNPELRRFADEFVRHKILDAIGDMALAGAPLRARFEGQRSSHALNNALLRALFAVPENYRLST